MDNNDISDIIKKLSSMINNESSQNTSTQNSSNNNSTNMNSEFSSNNIDMNTILKMQEIIKAMNSESHNSRSNLLRSLKPYLKQSRQDKVEQYIQLLNVEKIIKLFNDNETNK